MIHHGRRQNSGAFMTMIIKATLGQDIEDDIRRFVSNCDFCRDGFPLHNGKHQLPFGAEIPCDDCPEPAKPKPQLIIFKGRGLRKAGRES